MNFKNGIFQPRSSSGGPVTGFYALPDGSVRKIAVKLKNLTMYAAADCLGQLMSGNDAYRISYMYFEFANTTYTPPAYTAASSYGQPYYNGLSGGTADFIRVPLSFTPAISTSGSNYVSNQLAYTATTQATAGYWGKAFSSAASSQVYGGALVATPGSSFADDIVYARFYFMNGASFTPIPLIAGMSVGINWPIQFN